MFSGLILLVNRFSPFLYVLSVPHTTIFSISKELRSLGLKPISSIDNFESSLICEACRITLSYKVNSRAIWVLRRHTKENNHQIKAGWFLDEDNNIKEAKPKSKYKLFSSVIPVPFPPGRSLPVSQS